jgi:hypothetical protein|tara:strand:- start:3909 stop:4124 length:216 start_codon:yes stop_codon:yes gene_type:complete
MALIDSKQLSKDLSGSFQINTGSLFISGSENTTQGEYVLVTSGSVNTTGRVFEQGTSVVDTATALAIVFGG